MEHEFWTQRWENNEIGFHEREANPALVQHFPALALAEGSRIFLPLCGKTLDIGWLLEKGYRVAGAELSEIAIKQLFEELGVKPEVSDIGGLTHYSAGNIDIYGGDIFKLSKEILGPVNAAYDRAALVALPEPMRTRYAAHLMEITRQAPQLLITFVYDQSLLPGPPFSVTDGDVKRYYGGSYRLDQLESKVVHGGLKGKCPAEEHIWLLSRSE